MILLDYYWVKSNLNRVDFNYVEQVNTSLNGHSSAQSTVEDELGLARARRTAFVARFIVLREAKRTRSHRVIEMMEWEQDTSAEDLMQRFRQVFIENGDSMMPVDRDLRRALAHASRSIHHFIREYDQRATSNFIDALFDYERSNQLLFGEEDQPKPGGWRLPKELLKQKLNGEGKPRVKNGKINE